MKKEKDKKKKRAKHEQAEAAAGTVELLLNEEDGEAGEQPLRDAIAIVGGKWKLRILWALRAGESMRYGSIKQQISGITDMMLSQSLRELTSDGLTERRQFQEIPPKVEYCITQTGAELLPSIELLRAWALKHTEKSPK